MTGDAAGPLDVRRGDAFAFAAVDAAVDLLMLSY